MTVTIAHLYYDLLNLYGEVGNVRILKKVLEEQGIQVRVEFLTIGDPLEFKNYDFVYMGMGIEENLILVNEHLKPYKKDIEKYIESGKCMLCSGNSYELFGKFIRFPKQKIETLGIFSFTSKQLEQRKVLEVSAKSKYFDKKIIGFMNTRSFNNNKKNFFLTIQSESSSFKEGILYHNFIGTYTIGPLLIRNPDLLKKIVSMILAKKRKNYKLKEFHLNFLEQAYQDCLKRRTI